MASTPYAIVANVVYGYLRTLRIPEARVPNAVAHGWQLVICDSDMPPHVPDTVWNPQISSNRRHWLNETDVHPEGDDERCED